MKKVEKYIDMHVHVGSWRPDGIYLKKDMLLDVMQKNEVSAFCISNLDCIDMDSEKVTPKSEIDGNLSLFDIFADIPQANFICVCEPNKGSAENIRKLLKDYPKKFVGLKMHPLCHQIPADSHLYDPYMTLAQEYNLPCLFHSGHIDCPYSSPRLIYNLAKRHKSAAVILGHLSTGGISSKKEAIKLMKKSQDEGANLYADISWCDIDSVIKAISKLGSDKIMFGSDSPLGIFGDPSHYLHFVDAVKKAVVEQFPENAEDILEKVFYLNAKNLFKIEI